MNSNTKPSDNHETSHSIDSCAIDFFDYLRSIHGMKKKTIRSISFFMQPHDANAHEDFLSSFADEANAIWESCMACPEVPDVRFDEPNKGYAIKGRVNPFKRLAYRTKSVDCSEQGQNIIPIISDEFDITKSKSRKIITPLWLHESTQALAPLLTLILLRNYTDEKRLCFRVSKSGVTNICCLDVVADYLSELAPEARYAYTCGKRKSNPLLFSPYTLDIEFWTLICELKILYEMAKQNLTLRTKGRDKALPWDLQEQAVLFSLYNCNPFDILIDWLDIAETLPAFATDENFEVFLCLSLSPLFSENIESADFFRNKREQFMTQYYQENLRTISAKDFIKLKYDVIQYKVDYLVRTHSPYAAKALALLNEVSSLRRDEPFNDEPGSARKFIVSLPDDQKFIAGLNADNLSVEEALADADKYNKVVLSFPYTNAAYFINLFQKEISTPDGPFKKLVLHFFLESRFVSALDNEFFPITLKIYSSSYFADSDVPSQNLLKELLPASIFPPEEPNPFDVNKSDLMESVSRKFRRSDLFQYMLDVPKEKALYSLSPKAIQSYCEALDTLRQTEEGLPIFTRYISYLDYGCLPIWFIFHCGGL